MTFDEIQASTETFNDNLNKIFNNYNNYIIELQIRIEKLENENNSLKNQLENTKPQKSLISKLFGK